jgi:hypothetical protein
MLISFLKLVYCLIIVFIPLLFLCITVLVSNYFVLFLSFMAILLHFILPSINQFSLASFLLLLFCIPHCTICFNVSVLSSLSVTCFVSSIIVFQFFINIIVNIILIFHIFQYFELLLSSIAYSCFHFEFLKIFTIFLFSLYFSFFILNFTLKFISVSFDVIQCLVPLVLDPVAWGGGSSYSPGVIDANYSLSSPKTVCRW